MPFSEESKELLQFIKNQKTYEALLAFSGQYDISTDDNIIFLKETENYSAAIRDGNVATAGASKTTIINMMRENKVNLSGELKEKAYKAAEADRLTQLNPDVFLSAEEEVANQFTRDQQNLQRFKDALENPNEYSSPLSERLKEAQKERSNFGEGEADGEDPFGELGGDLSATNHAVERSSRIGVRHTGIATDPFGGESGQGTPGTGGYGSTEEESQEHESGEHPVEGPHK